MLALLTWPAYGSRFPRPGRGRIEGREPGDPHRIPEPARRANEGGGRLKWPPAHLDGRMARLIIEDTARIAALRSFEPMMIVVAPDHVHLLLSCEDDRDVNRLVQLIKGALSRMLTVAAGDAPARSTSGELLPHHKWWTRRHSFIRIPDGEALEQVKVRLRAHAEGGAAVWEA